MLRSTLRFALRSLWRRPGTSLVHAGGLAVGIACCFLALLYVQDERSTDRFHEHAEQIVTVQQQFMYGDMPVQIQTATPEAVEALRTQAPGVEAVAVTDVTTGFVRSESGRAGIALDAVRFADPAFFDVFTFPLAAGDVATALAAPGQAVLTETLARSLFGRTDVIGEDVFVERTGFGVPDPEPLALTVTAVAEDPPEASSLPFEMLVSGSTPVASFDGPAPALDSSKPTFVRLASLADTMNARAAMQALRSDGDEATFSFLPLVDVHFSGSSDSMTGRATYLILFST
ncbi:MAG: ABC transporter permease, partial [Bacteroidota bacterium]